MYVGFGFLSLSLSLSYSIITLCVVWRCLWLERAPLDDERKSFYFPRHKLFSKSLLQLGPCCQSPIENRFNWIGTHAYDLFSSTPRFTVKYYICILYTLYIIIIPSLHVRYKVDTVWCRLLFLISTWNCVLFGEPSESKHVEHFMHCLLVVVVTLTSIILIFSFR